MIAHHELVTGQRIERVLQLLGLGDREVPGVHHPVELALQQRLARGFGEKGKRLGEDEGKRRREERIEHADVGRGRILLDAEHRARARPGRQAVLERFGSEGHARGREHLVDRRARQRHLPHSPLIRVENKLSGPEYARPPFA